MKKIPVAILGASVGFAVASWVVSDRLSTRHAGQLARQQAAWQAEKAALQLALGMAKTRVQAIAAPVAPAPAAAPAVPTKLSPAEIVAKLFALKSAPANQTRAGRQVIYWLEELIAAGPAALPAIRDFLNHNEDIDFAPVNQGKGGRGGNGDSILPLSLRFGLQGLPDMLRGRKGTLYFATSQNKVEMKPERIFADELGAEPPFQDAQPVDDIPRLEKNWFDCIRTGGRPFAHIDLAIRGQTVLCLAEMSERLSLTLLFDEKTRKISTGDGRVVPPPTYDSIVPSRT